MRPGRFVLPLAALLASPAFGQTPSQPLGERTGPQAQPPAPPAYAKPEDLGFTTPSTPAGQLRAAPSSAPVTEVRVSAEGPHGPATPPPRWTPPADSPGFTLEHTPGQPLDEAWVRRQFARNGLPGSGGVSQALAVVQLVNRAYLSAGFLNSGLIVRPQPAPGVLDLRVVYGGLASPTEREPPIAVAFADDRAKGLTAAYVRDRMPAAGRRPLNAQALERDFRLLAEDPAIRTINADLRPGANPGEASLAVIVYPQDRFDLYVTAANNRSPSVGGERLSAGGHVRNLVFAGDLLGGEAGVTDGVEDVTLSYATPFLSPRNTLAIRGAYNDAAVIDGQLQLLDIEARERSAELSLTRKLVDRPLLPTPQAGRWAPARTLTVGAAFAFRRSTSYLLGQRFSFAPGAVNGRTEYKAVRLLGDYVVRNVDQVFAVSITSTLGLDGTRSDIPGLPVPDERFKAVLAQVNYARRLSVDGLELRARLYGQWAPGVLYSGERLTAGGESTVRGYRENLLLADRGVIGSVELARPFSLSGRRGAASAFDWGAFNASVFADGALMRNDKDPQPDARHIYSVGASLAWIPSDAVSARITYAEALKDIAPPGSRDLQDRGVQFRVTVRPLRAWAALQ